MMVSAIYSCDQCGTVAKGEKDRPPRGWGFARWVPGVVNRPGAPPQPPEGNRQFCSRRCHEAWTAVAMNKETE